MIAEAFEGNKWVENTGVRPDVDVFIDTKWRNGDVDECHRANKYAWHKANIGPYITHWRIHQPVDAILPEPTRPAPPMPYVKPAKPEPSNVLKAFNRMTGHSLTEDNLVTLKILMEEFGN